MNQQRTSLWALENSFDARIEAERKRVEKKLLDEAMAEISELRSYELIDDGSACYAGER